MKIADELFIYVPIRAGSGHAGVRLVHKLPRNSHQSRTGFIKLFGGQQILSHFLDA